MFAYIRGRLAVSTPLYCILEASGIGYKIFIPASLFSKLPQIGEEALLHCSYIVREMSQALYGFDTAQERDIFDALLNVSGIGPKIALSIIGHLPLHDLQSAIARHDLSVLCKIPGIGKKTAERLVIEMRDKLQAIFPPDPSGLAVDLQADPLSQTILDAMSALINLGYNQNAAQKAIKKSMDELPESTELPVIITTALKHI